MMEQNANKTVTNIVLPSPLELSFLHAEIAATLLAKWRWRLLTSHAGGLPDLFTVASMSTLSIQWAMTPITQARLYGQFWFEAYHNFVSLKMMDRNEIFKLILV